LAVILADLVFLGQYACNLKPTVSVQDKISKQEVAKSTPIVTAPKETEEQQLERQIVRCGVQLTSAGGQGSGVVIYQDKKIAYIMTALHVVNHTGFKFYAKYVDFNNYIEEEVTLVNADADLDLAIVSTKPVWTNIAKIVPRASDVRLYSRIWTYGFLGRVMYTGVLTEGRISDFENYNVTGRSRMLTSCPVIYGNSGGGYWCKIDGEFMLVGIACNVFVYERGHVEQAICHVSLGANPTQMLTFLRKTIADSK
jgi:S1-C subfamily serine protease